jgi:hypothetical protein
MENLIQALQDLAKIDLEGIESDLIRLKELDAALDTIQLARTALSNIVYA